MMNIIREKLRGPQKEFEQMKILNSMSIYKAEWIMNIRLEYQNEIQKPSINLCQFRGYIDFEQSILIQITDSYDILDECLIATTIRRKIIKRIANLYEHALRRFPTDIDLLVEFIAFCKERNQSIRVHNMITEMVIVLKPDNAEMWQTFANWYWHDHYNINAAMNVLLNGIKIHISNTVFYIEMIKILVHLWSEFKNFTDRFELMQEKQIEETVYNKLNNVTDLNFCIELLGVLETKEFTGNIQYMIVSHMEEKYKENVLVWHTIAQRYFRGFYADNDHLMKLKAAKEDMVKAQWVAGCAKYIIGVRSVPQENKKKMYKLYIEFLFTTQNYGNDTMRDLITDTLNITLNKGHQKKYLLEEHYLQWVEFDEANAMTIYEKGISHLYKAPKLREKHLQLLISNNNSTVVDDTFNEGIQALQEESLPLWLSFIHYHSNISSENRLEEIYKQAAQQSKEVSDVLKPEYLDWIIRIKGIEVARKVYWDLANQKPYCKELHTLMSKTESLQVVYNFDSWYKVHKLDCEQFGEEDINVWIRYIEFCILYKNFIEHLGLCVEEIYRQAENALPITLFREFSIRYAALFEGPEICVLDQME